MNTFLNRIITLVFVFICFVGHTQTGINTGSPASCAELEIYSTSKGVLLPTLTDAQMLAIASPATGLIIYNTTNSNYYYYNGTMWARVGTKGNSLYDSDADNGIVVERNTNDNNVRFDIGNSSDLSFTDYIKVNSSGVSIADAMFLKNTGFEPPLTPVVAAGTYSTMDASLLVGWKTTATDNKIEIWGTGYKGVPAAEGVQFAELNANYSSRLYQTINLKNGETLSWEYYHRGRAAVDSAEFNIYSSNGSTKLVTLQKPSTGTGAWTKYSGSWTVSLATGSYQLSFESLTAGTIGNFLDGFTTTMSSIDGSYHIPTGNTLKIGATPLIMPSAAGNNGNVLSTDGAGNWYWAEPHGGLGVANGIETMYFGEAYTAIALGNNTYFTPVIPFSSISVDTMEVYIETLVGSPALQVAIYNAAGDTLATSEPSTPSSTGIFKMRLRGSGYGVASYTGPLLSSASQYYFAITDINKTATTIFGRGSSNNPFTKKASVSNVASMYDFATTQDGWNTPFNMTVSAAASINTLTITGTDAYFHSPDALGLNASTYKYIIIKAQNNTTNTSGQLYWTTTLDGAWNSTKSMSFYFYPSDANQRYYILDMSTNPDWTGTIKQIRFDPANGPATSGTVFLDYIKIAANYEVIIPAMGSPATTGNSIWISAY